MADGGGQGVPREVPSEALDRLFLELLDQLPKESRGRFAQLADDVKRMTESSTAEDPMSPSPSADQVVVRREEEIATAEVKQSSGELQARGVVTSLSDQPTLKDVDCFAVPRVAPKWYDLGLALDVKPFVLDTISQEQQCPDQPRTMLAKWLEGCPGTGSQPRTWQNVLDAVGTICGSAAVEDIRTAVQTPRIPTAELPRKCRRSSCTSSDDLDLQQSVAKKSLPDYMTIKMDLLAQDMSDLRSESDPEVIIKLLYGNALTTISDLLKPHLKAVKEAAGRLQRLGLHHVSVGEDIIESADSIDSLMSRMSVGGMWDSTRFLRKAITSIPHSAPEQSVAEAILLHYDQHLAIYKWATLLKDALTKESESKQEVEASTEANKLVPVTITSSKAFDNFSCEECHILQVQGLKKAYGIPGEKIICRDVEEHQTFDAVSPSAPHTPSSPMASSSSSMAGRTSLPSPMDTDVGSPCHPELGMEPVLIESPDEVLLKKLCYMATGIQQLHVGPGGGTFTLGCSDATLKVPRGALKKETSVHFAIILHGPFVFSTGCKPGSVVVYVNMDGAALVKPVCLSLSHWCSREEEGGNTLKFIRAPHVPDAQMKYFFEELEEGDFTTHTNVGVLTISEPQCLYCVEMKNEEVARYNALTFQKNGASASTLIFRIQLMCDSKEWNKTVEGALQKNGWSSCSSDVATFSFATEESDQKRTIAACPVDAKGPGWICRIEGEQLISEDLFLKLKNKTHEELEGEVNSGRFPPNVRYKLRYTSPQERRPQPSLMMVDLKGTNENLKLSFDIMEEAMALSLPSSPQQTSINPRDSGASMPHPPPTLPPPDTADIIEALNHQLDGKWRHFGTFLRVDYQTMEAIRLDNGGRPDDCMLDLLSKWTSNQVGTGTLPRTWQTLVEVVRKTGYPVIAENLAHKYGVTRSQ